MKFVYLIVCSVLAVVIVCINGESKYSRDLNMMADFLTTDNPFRMRKLNILWEKAKKRLAPEKLKLFHTELKMQDKEEITWKRLKAEGEDKDGLKEALLRKKLRGILARYDLTEHFDSIHETKALHDDKHNDALDKFNDNFVFKDQKLNKLWLKAERAGFSDEELKMLKEEFQHQQEKLNDYHEFMNSESSKEKQSNSVEADFNPEAEDFSKKLKEKHRDVKQNYDRLGKLAALGPEDSEFEESKVKMLWSMAQGAKFTPEELDSLKEELKHYDHRVRKLRHMQAEVDFAEASNKFRDDSIHDRKRMEDKIDKYSKKVNKVHLELEGRIMQRHLEL